MYRCGICPNVSPPRQPQRRHPVLRPNGQIAREVSVCSACAALLDRGWTLAAVAAERKPEPAPSHEAPLEARLNLPVQVGVPAKPASDWRDGGIKGVLTGCPVGGTAQVVVKKGLYLRFRRLGLDEWQFGDGRLANRMDLVDAVEHVKKQMG